MVHRRRWRRGTENVIHRKRRRRSRRRRDQEGEDSYLGTQKEEEEEEKFLSHKFPHSCVYSYICCINCLLKVTFLQKCLKLV